MDQAEAVALDETLPKSLRLRRRRDFSRVQRTGARGASPHLQAVMRPGRGLGRFGLTVSKKVGNAVARNLVKRRLREILRKQRALFERRDLVIIARPGAAEVPWSELRKEVELAVNKAAEEMQRRSRGKRRS